MRAERTSCFWWTVPVVQWIHVRSRFPVQLKIMPYGAFVDIGAERDTLVHISQLEVGWQSTPLRRFPLNTGEVLHLYDFCGGSENGDLPSRGFQPACCDQEYRTQTSRSYVKVAFGRSSVRPTIDCQAFGVSKFVVVVCLRTVSLSTWRTS